MLYSIEKNLENIVKYLLLAVVFIIPLIYTGTLYFPYISGKAYVFRALIALAFFFWSWWLLDNSKSLPVQSGKLKAKSLLVIAIGIFFLTQILAATFGVDPRFSFFSGVERADGVIMYGFFLLYFLMILSVFKTDDDWKKLFYVFFGSAAASSLYVMVGGGDVGWLGSQIIGLFGNPAYFGGYLIFAIGFVFLSLLFPGAPRKILYSLAAFLILVLILTQIRGVYVGFSGGVGLFCLLSFLFLRRENKRFAYACGAVILIGVVFLAGLFAAKNTPFVQDSYILSRITEISDFNVSSVRERLLNWSIALKAFQDKPFLGYGPWNFGAAANKHYDYRLNSGEPWFDHPHNQPLGVLATSGIIGFAAYLFWIFAVIFLIYKISRQNKILSFILVGTFAAYFLQSLFLFDFMPVYLGLFPFLAFLVYLAPRARSEETLGAQTAWSSTAVEASERERSGAVSRRSERTPGSEERAEGAKIVILILAALISIFAIYFTVIMPWRANHATWNFYNLSQNHLYKESIPSIQKAFAINSPYTSWEMRGLAAQQLYDILWRIDETTPVNQLNEISELYDFMQPELEKFAEERSVYPQTYFIVPTIYRLGSEKLGKDDFEKAIAHLKKAFKQSDLRIEYALNYAKILLLQGKFGEAEAFMKDYTGRFPEEWGIEVPNMFMGDFYYEAEKYDLSLASYKKAEEKGLKIYSNEEVYSRYMLAAEKAGDYEKILKMALLRLDYIKKPDADTYFNIALGYYYADKKEAGREFMEKAAELNSDYKQFIQLFL